MRKLVIISICLCLIFLGACKNITPTNTYENIENEVAIELEKLDNNYSDETLKALSVVVRTNLYLNNTNTLLDKNQSTNDKYKIIANQTKSKILKNNKGNIIEIPLSSNSDYKWQKNIKKSKLLEFALKNNISLTSIKNITPDIKNNKIVGLNIGNKYFDYLELAKEFNLESNQIENISESVSEIIIQGKSKGFENYFDLEKAQQLSNNNYIFEEILKYFFENFELLNFKC